MKHESRWVLALWWLAENAPFLVLMASMMVAVITSTITELSVGEKWVLVICVGTAFVMFVLSLVHDAALRKRHDAIVHNKDVKLAKVTAQRGRLLAELQVLVHEVQGKAPFVVWLGREDVQWFSDREIITDPDLFLQKLKSAREALDAQGNDR